MATPQPLPFVRLLSFCSKPYPAKKRSMSNQERHRLSFDLLIRHTAVVPLPFSVLLIALTVGHVFLPAGLSIVPAADNSVHGQKHTPSPNDEGFTDVTKESGVAAL